MKYCFGVDIGGTTIKIGLFTSEGKILEKWEIETKTENEGSAIIPDIAKSLNEIRKEKQITKAEMAGIGVGIPAPVQKDGIVKNTVNLGWKYKNVKKELEELTGLEVVAGNDANVAALGEMWLGAGKGQENAIMVTLGTGVGGGIIVNGKPLTGAHGAGGEIGHICVNYEEEERCGCGKQGCLEQYASATGITRMAKEYLDTHETISSLRYEKLSAKSIFDALKEGDEVAEMIVEKFGEYLGYAMANLAVIIDPSVIIIGGGVANAGDILLKYVEKYFCEKVFFANKEVRFVRATLGNDAGMCGAAKLILT